MEIHHLDIFRINHPQALTQTLTETKQKPVFPATVRVPPSFFNENGGFGRRGSDGGPTGVRRGSDGGQTGVRRGSDGGQTDPGRPKLPFSSKIEGGTLMDCRKHTFLLSFWHGLVILSAANPRYEYSFFSGGSGQAMLWYAFHLGFQNENHTTAKTNSITPFAHLGRTTALSTRRR
jgi:hypothetical protein